MKDNGRNYCWIHFEGRNVEKVSEMIRSLEGSGLTVSVEIEKVGRRHEELIPLGDVVIVSKDVAKDHGALNPSAAVKEFKDLLKKGAKLIVPWGESGAAGYDSGAGQEFLSPAFPPAGGVVDTLGAGDAFNGALIGCLARHITLEKSLKIACKVAGAKVGRIGFQGLKNVYLAETKNIGIDQGTD
jgi:ketohexokinase